MHMANTSNPLNVAILMPLATQRGGGELMLAQFLKHSRRAPVRWLVIFFEEGPLVAEFQRLGADTCVVPTGRLRHIHCFAKAVLQIATLLRRHHVDLVFSWSAKPHLYGSLAALVARIPAAWYQLGYPSASHLTPIDRAATLFPARGVVTLSQASATAQAQLWPKRSVHMVYPSVELERFDPTRLPSPATLRQRLGLPETGPLIGMVGRLQRWKGMHVLIEAMPAVLAAHPDAHAVIIGGDHVTEPEYARELEHRTGEIGLRDRVHLVGFQRNVPEWMHAMDVIVHASNHEPFGIVVIEAMALGKAVVAGDSVGPREIITDGINGLLAPYGDADRLARQIARYLDDPAFACQVGQAARRRALDFTPEQYAETLFQTLRKLI